MKKTIIAAGAASVALAAMPVVGVFAATQSSVEDTVQLTVSSTCEMQADTASATYNLGTSTVAHEYAETSGTPLTITCNDQAGWSITAVATALGASGTTQTIPFGAYSNAGESVWSARIALTGNDTANATIATGWDDNTATTAAGGAIVSGNSNSGVSGLVVTPYYKAYGSAHQAAGTYSGTITYTFTGSAS